MHIIGAADEPLGRIAHDGAIILPMNRGACQYRTGIPGSLHRARAIVLRTNVSRLITPDQDFPAFIKAGEEYAHEPPLNARISCQNWRYGRGFLVLGESGNAFDAQRWRGPVWVHGRPCRARRRRGGFTPVSGPAGPRPARPGRATGMNRDVSLSCCVRFPFID